MGRPEKVRAVILGVVVGFVLGVTSAGSGALIAVGLIMLFHLVPQRVVGTDVFHAAILLWAAALAHIVAGNVDFLLAGQHPAGLGPGRLGRQPPVGADPGRHAAQGAGHRPDRLRAGAADQGRRGRARVDAGGVPGGRGAYWWPGRYGADALPALRAAAPSTSRAPTRRPPRRPDTFRPRKRSTPR